MLALSNFKPSPKDSSGILVTSLVMRTVTKVDVFTPGYIRKLTVQYYVFSDILSHMKLESPTQFSATNQRNILSPSKLKDTENQLSDGHFMSHILCTVTGISPGRRLREGSWNRRCCITDILDVLMK